MARQVFLEVHDGSDADLDRVLTMAGRLACGGPVIISCAHELRERVDRLLDLTVTGPARAHITLLDTADRMAAIPAVESAGTCVFSDAELSVHLRGDQVAVYSPQWRAAQE